MKQSAQSHEGCTRPPPRAGHRSYLSAGSRRHVLRNSSLTLLQSRNAKTVALMRLLARGISTIRLEEGLARQSALLRSLSFAYAIFSQPGLLRQRGTQKRQHAVPGDVAKRGQLQRIMSTVER